MIIIIGLVTFTILYVNVEPFRSKVNKTFNCRKKDYTKKDAKMNGDQKLDNQYYKYDDEIKSHQYINAFSSSPSLVPPAFNLKDLITRKKQDLEETDYYDVNLDNIEEYNKYYHN